MENKDLFKPGQIATDSGQYEIVGPRGRKTNQERTVVAKEPFPPTPKPNLRYALVDPTKHKNNKK